MASHDIIDVQSGSHLDTLLSGILNALWAINDQLKPLDNAIDNNTTEVTKWLGVVAEAIANIQPLPQPQPQTRGTIMASYSIPDDQPDAGFTLAITATDSEGVPITDPAVLAALTVEIINSDDTVFAATLGSDGRSGTYHVGAPGQATVTQNLKDAAGTLLATGTDGFTVTTGKVALGSVNATFDGLTPVA